MAVVSAAECSASSGTAAARQQLGASSSGAGVACGPQQLQQARAYASGARGLVPSRKPAIKKPARHQWYYCAMDYDPMLPKPSNPLPPYAPPRAHLKDYQAVFSAQMPQHHRNSFRRGWSKQTKLADQAWKDAWLRSRAKHERWEASVQRRAEAIARREAWAAWKEEQQQQQEEEGQQQQRQQQQQEQQQQPQQGESSSAQPSM